MHIDSSGAGRRDASQADSRNQIPTHTHPRMRPRPCVPAPSTGEARPWGGVFVGGAAPLWLVADRGRLLAHPAPADGHITAFTTFHNHDCQRVGWQGPPLVQLWCGSAAPLRLDARSFVTPAADGFC